MKTRKALAEAIKPAAVRAAGAVRRMAISVTAKTLWQLLGHKMPDGDQETFSAELFSGIGFYARPSSSGKPEAIVLNIGDAKAPVIVATRDEKTRGAVAGSLAANETAMFNDASIVVVKSTGVIEARSKSGIAKRLMTVDDGLALVSAITDAAVLAGDGGATFKANLIAALATWPTGTSKLKGE